jgi:hypothetical protein
MLAKVKTVTKEETNPRNFSSDHRSSRTPEKGLLRTIE